MKYHYFQRRPTYPVRRSGACTSASFGLKVVSLMADLCGRHSQVGSLAGAAHLLNDNAGVLR